ncbi:MAG TPA: ACT domain-containing protein [Gammaproteobacteria bacterium]|nr:ACT domain-containing protein [Gammaproteobacteria bacterium]
MNHTLQMNIQKVEGAIIRLLGLIERRGFCVTAMNAHSDDAAQQVQITVDLHCGSRSVETLTRQIEKLYDVRSVACLTASEPAVVMKESVAC